MGVSAGGVVPVVGEAVAAKLTAMLLVCESWPPGPWTLSVTDLLPYEPKS